MNIFASRIINSTPPKVEFSGSAGVGVAVWKSKTAPKLGHTYSAEFDLNVPLISGINFKVSDFKRYNLCVREDGKLELAGISNFVVNAVTAPVVVPEPSAYAALAGALALALAAWRRIRAS